MSQSPCLCITDGRTDVRTDIFPPLILLGRLLEVDLMKRNGNAERRRRKNRGAQGAEGVGSGRDIPSPVRKGLGRGCAPTQKCF